MSSLSFPRSRSLRHMVLTGAACFYLLAGGADLVAQAGAGGGGTGGGAGAAGAGALAPRAGRARPVPRRARAVRTAPAVTAVPPAARPTERRTGNRVLPRLTPLPPRPESIRASLPRLSLDHSPCSRSSSKRVRPTRHCWRLRPTSAVCARRSCRLPCVPIRTSAWLGQT